MKRRAVDDEIAYWRKGRDRWNHQRRNSLGPDVLYAMTVEELRHGGYYKLAERREREDRELSPLSVTFGAP